MKRVIPIAFFLLTFLGILSLGFALSFYFGNNESHLSKVIFPQTEHTLNWNINLTLQ